MHNPLKIRSQGGYTLLECILHLLIMTVFIQLFMMFFYWKDPIEKQYADYTSTEWELFSVDIQMILSEINEFTLLDNGFSIKKNDNYYQINQNGTVIRQQKGGEGHLPLLTGIRSAIYTFDGMYLALQVTMHDGSVKERSFAVGLVPE